MQTVSVDELKHAIQSLPKKDYISLRDWLIKTDWELWDKEIETHSKQGKLDFLIQEAMNEKEEGELKQL